MHSASTNESRRSLTAAVLIGISAAFLFCGYEFIRSTASTLFKQAYGKERLPDVMAALPVAVLLMLYGYGRCLSRYGPRRTLLITSLLSGGAIFACYALIVAQIKLATAALYIIREAYVILITEQLWSFLNSHLSVDQGRKLNGPICGLGSIGAISGAWFVKTYSQSLGTVTMLVFGSVAILPALLFSMLAYRSCGEPRPETLDAPASDGNSDTLGVRLFTRNRMLLMLLLIVIATQVVSAMTDLAFQGELQDRYPNADEQNAYSGEFFMWLNFFSAAGQFVLAPLLLSTVPAAVVLFVLPVANVAACLYAQQSPSLQSYGIAYQSFKALDYSLFRAAKELLYIPLSFDARFRAKELIDVWGYRFSKGASTAVLALFKNWGWIILSGGLYIGIATAAAATWLVLTPFLVKNARQGRQTARGGIDA